MGSQAQRSTLAAMCRRKMESILAGVTHELSACGKIALADSRQCRTIVGSFSGAPGASGLVIVVTDDTAEGLR